MNNIDWAMAATSTKELFFLKSGFLQTSMIRASRMRTCRYVGKRWMALQLLVKRAWKKGRYKTIVKIFCRSFYPLARARWDRASCPGSTYYASSNTSENGSVMLGSPILHLESIERGTKRGQGVLRTAFRISWPPCLYVTLYHMWWSGQV